MENANEFTSLTLDSLLGTFTEAQIHKMKEVLIATELKLKEIPSRDFRQIYANGTWVKILDMLETPGEDKSKIQEKFKQKEITCIKIGDQIVRIADKPQDKGDTFLVR